MNAKSLFTVAFALLPFTTATAQDVSHTAEASFKIGTQAPTISIPVPAQSLGTPIAMRVELLVGIQGKAGVENLGKEAAQAMLYTTYGASISAVKGQSQLVGGGQFQLAAGGQFAQIRNLDEHDGTTDFLGASGRTMLLRDASPREAQMLQGKILSQFLGNFAGKSLLFDISGGSSSSLMGLEYGAQSIDAIIVVQVNVTYTYQNTPSGGSGGSNLAAMPFIPPAAAKQPGTTTAQVVNSASGNKK